MYIFVYYLCLIDIWLEAVWINMFVYIKPCSILKQSRSSYAIDHAAMDMGRVTNIREVRYAGEMTPTAMFLVLGLERRRHLSCIGNLALYVHQNHCHGKLATRDSDENKVLLIISIRA